MTKPVEVKVLRLHSGDYGQKVEGEIYETNTTHARELAAQGLVEVIEHKAEGLPALKPAAEPPAPTPPVTKTASPPKRPRA